MCELNPQLNLLTERTYTILQKGHIHTTKLTTHEMVKSNFIESNTALHWIR